VEEYAKMLHMSTCWFIRSFKQYAGMPPGKYITSIRINKAKELLESTDYTVGEVGTIIGYDNPLYFSRIFKKQTGLCPAEYRKAAR
jgi:AraC-like DNA-binding protein